MVPRVLLCASVIVDHVSRAVDVLGLGCSSLVRCCFSLSALAFQHIRLEWLFSAGPRFNQGYPFAIICFSFPSLSSSLLQQLDVQTAFTHLFLTFAHNDTQPYGHWQQLSSVSLLLISALPCMQTAYYQPAEKKRLVVTAYHFIWDMSNL